MSKLPKTFRDIIEHDRESEVIRSELRKGTVIMISAAAVIRERRAARIELSRLAAIECRPGG